MALSGSKMRNKRGASSRESWVLGIDLGGTTLKACLADARGRLRAQESSPSPTGGSKSFQMSFVSLVRSVLREAPGRVSIAAAGIGCKGIAEPDRCAVRILPGVFRFLEGKRMDAWVHQALGSFVPVGLENDAKVALLGELRWGAARGKRNVILLTLGSGVGGAILSEGRILQGATGVAGHLGHTTVAIDGPLCMCGNRGCVEAFFSARAIEGAALAAIRRGCESRLQELFGKNPESVTCRDVFTAAWEDDELARGIIRRAVSALAAAMTSLAHGLDPEVFLVGGQIASAGEMLLAPLRKEFYERTHRLVGRRIPVLKATLGERAGLLGAAALGWSVLENR